MTDPVASPTPGGDRSTAGTPSSTAASTTTAPSTSAGSTTAAPLGRGQAEALDAALAGEHAAVYAYGVVGGQGLPADRPRALAELHRHAVRRDLLVARLAAAGRRPAPPQPAYALPVAVTSPGRARTLAAQVEQALAATHADLVAASPPADRLAAARWLAECTLAAHRWGAPVTAFPGLPERLGR